MPGFKTHRNINLITGFLASFLYFNQNPLQILLFMLGVLESSYIHSPDIDKKNSIPYKNLWILQPIYKPFTNYGHREVLHNPLWGLVVLVLPLKVICEMFVPVEMPGAYWFGMVWAVEAHIVTDWIS